MHTRRAFTLLELMVVLAVASILLSVGVPSFRGVVMDNRMVDSANQFVTAVNMARSSAVRYQRNATICSSTNWDAAVPTCNGTADWSEGWIVWVDKDRDGATAAAEIVAVHEPLHESVAFVASTNNRFSYDSRGFGGSAGDTLSLCDERTGETVRVIRVNAMAGPTSILRPDRDDRQTTQPSDSGRATGCIRATSARDNTY